jgi:hypothetical protein
MKQAKYQLVYQISPYIVTPIHQNQNIANALWVHHQISGKNS